jgi:hypothetical protein
MVFFLPLSSLKTGKRRKKFLKSLFKTYIPTSLLLVFLAMILWTCGGGGGGGNGGGGEVTLTGLTINGPSSVNESNTATYAATASWSDGATSSCTPSWAVAPTTYASISADGVLTTLPVPSDQKVFVSAAYVHEGITETDTFEVTILDVPAPATTTLSASAISHTGATLNGSVNPNGLATNAWFEWGTSPTLASYAETAPQSLGAGISSQSITQTLSGLSQGTTYYFRVAASNSAGVSMGTIVSFSTTSPPLTFGVVSTTPANNVTEIPVGNTITVTFNQDVDPATLGSGITASSYIGPLPGSVSYNSSTKTATFTPGTPFAPLTTYNVTVATTVKSAGGEALSAPYTFGFKTITAFC